MGVAKVKKEREDKLPSEWMRPELEAYLLLCYENYFYNLYDEVIEKKGPEDRRSNLYTNREVTTRRNYQKDNGKIMSTRQQGWGDKTPARYNFWLRHVLKERKTYCSIGIEREYLEKYKKQKKERADQESWARECKKRKIEIETTLCASDIEEDESDDCRVEHGSNIEGV